MKRHRIENVQLQEKLNLPTEFKVHSAYIIFVVFLMYKTALSDDIASYQEYLSVILPAE